MDLRDSPCIFSGSNGHVPPLIEGGRGVELPGEIRGNELKVTRARETFSSLSLSFSFRTPRFSLVGTTLAHQQNFSPLHRRYHHQATTGSLTTTRDTSITEISTLSPRRDSDKKKRRKRNRPGKNNRESVRIRLFPRLGPYTHANTCPREYLLEYLCGERSCVRGYRSRELIVD